MSTVNLALEIFRSRLLAEQNVIVKQAAEVLENALALNRNVPSEYQVLLARDIFCTEYFFKENFPSLYEKVEAVLTKALKE